MDRRNYRLIDGLTTVKKVRPRLDPESRIKSGFFIYSLTV